MPRPHGMIARAPLRTVSPLLPAEIGGPRRPGLHAVAAARAGARPRGGVVILHGAGSCKESHHDFARGAAWPPGSAAIAFDQRGHGESDGPMDGRRDRRRRRDGRRCCATRDRRPTAPLALRGSSMGGYLALAGRAGRRARSAVVAICPASAGRPAPRPARRAASRSMPTPPALEALLGAHDLHDAVAGARRPAAAAARRGRRARPGRSTRASWPRGACIPAAG